MRRIAVINQKGGVGKTTTCTNLGAALARLGRRVLLVDMDPQANLTMHLAVESLPETPSIYTVLLGETKVEEAVQPTSTEGLFLIPSNIDLSGAELELASAIGRETILKDALDEWQSRTAGSDENYDYLIFDCAPSLGLLTINALTATSEVVITLQTEFFALQGMSKLIEIVGLLKRRLNPTLEVSGILPCLYDSRLKLAREVLAEIRSYFPEQVLPYPIRNNIKLAEAPSYGQTIFEYAADSNGAEDHLRLARSIIEQESQRAPQVAARYAEPEQASEDTAKKEGASGDD
ncbi:MAG: chromosome partitioning protein, partial [Planctomycetota bacterium]